MWQKYSPEGLAVLSVTTDSESIISRFMETTEVLFPVATGSNAGSDYRIRGTPSAFLVDHEGTILWQGHPAMFNWDSVPGALKAAREASTDWDPGERHKVLNKAVDLAVDGKFGSSWKETDKLLKKHAADLALAKEIARFRTDLNAFGEQRLARARQHGEDGCYHLAQETLGDTAKAFKGVPVAEEMSAQLSEWKKDAKVKKLAGFDKKRLDAIEHARSGNRDKAVKILKGLKADTKGTQLEDLVRSNYEAARGM